MESSSDPAVNSVSEDSARRPRRRAGPEIGTGLDRSRGSMIWYRIVQYSFATLFGAFGGWRSTGREDFPARGGVLLVSNHLSYLDVCVLGIPLSRPLNFVARSTLFVPILGAFIRSLGAFPIQRDGIGASGMKETLRRLRNGGIVTLFPEGTRTRDGELGPLKSGIAVLVSRAGVPVVPAAIAGTFESWPRSQRFPAPHPIRIHYGPPILPEEIQGLGGEAVTALIARRMKESQEIARHGLSRDLDRV